MPEPGKPPPRDRPEREPPPEAGLTVILWLLAALLAIVELIWWFSRAIYGS